MPDHVAGNRRTVAAALAVVVAGVALLMAPVVGVSTAVPASAVCGALVFGLVDDTRGSLWRGVGAGSAVVSTVVSVLALALDERDVAEGAAWGLVELGALLALVALATRRSADRWSWLTVALLGLAATTWVLRYLPDRRLTTVVVGLSLSAVGPLLAALVGMYLRAADRRTAGKIEVAQAEQRRQLERDLHDYVAHDLSAIITQAQAATFASGDDPAALRSALERIEGAGLKAMDSMDTALRLLRTDPAAAGPADSPRRTLQDLANLVAEFDRPSEGTTRVSLPTSAPPLSPVVWETLYRCTAEALTNVRRHASAADVEVDLDLRAAPGEVVLRVANHSARPGLPRVATGGTGLPGLAARVEALGGELVAGPTATGWVLEVSLPDEPTARDDA